MEEIIKTVLALSPFIFFFDRVYQWFLVSKHKLYFWSVLAFLYIILLVLSYFEFVHIERLRSINPQNVDFSPAVIIFLFLFAFYQAYIGVVVLVAAAVRRFQKKPAKNYIFLGSVLIGIYVVIKLVTSLHY